MFLLRSTFWLTVAYIALVPQLDISRSMTDVSAQALNAGQQIISGRIDATQCSTLDCMGAKMVFTAGLNSLSPQQNPVAEILNEASTPLASSVPFPLPRLSRPD